MKKALIMILAASMALAGCAERSTSGGTASLDADSATASGTVSASTSVGPSPAVFFEIDESFDRLYVGAQTSANADWSRIQVWIKPADQMEEYYDVYLGNSAGEAYGDPYGYQNEGASRDGAVVDGEHPVPVTNRSATMKYVFRAADFIAFCADGPVYRNVVTLIDMPTGAQLGRYEFQSIETCGNY